MTKIVQINGGSAAAMDVYVGPIREITADTTNKNLRLHDGVTPGGFIIDNVDNNDQRYQAKSLELDGLISFAAEERGILCRQGPSDYVIRDLTVNPDNLTITEADGYAGNPYISLATTIQSDHNWTGENVFDGNVGFGAAGEVIFESAPTFNQGLVVASGHHVTGDLVGNVTGNLTGNSTGTHTGAQVGNVDVRSHTLQLDNDQIPTTAIAGLLAYVEAHGVPGGVILMWSGTADGIPSGWFLCNGLNGTPDLRNRFIRGAGVGGGFDAPGITDGVDSITPTGSSASAGAHTHTLSGNVNDSSTGITLAKVFKQVDAADQTGCMDNVTMTDPGHHHAQGGTADSAGAHTHTITCDEQENRPAYYALCFIMKG